MISPDYTSQGWKGKWSISWENSFDPVVGLFILKKVAQKHQSHEHSRSSHIVLREGETTARRVEYSSSEILLLPKYSNVQDIHKMIDSIEVSNITRCISDLPDMHAPLRFRSPASTNQPLQLLILVPIDQFDNRWKSMGVPPAPLIIAGIARQAGIVPKIVMIDVNHLDETMHHSADIVAISLIEDMFIAVQRTLNSVRSWFSGPVIVGGPMVTTAPVIVAAHLADGDVFLRGDAEVILPDVLSKISNGFEPSHTINSLHSNPWPPGTIVRALNGWLTSDCDHVPEADPIGDPPCDYSVLNSTAVSNGLEFSSSRGCPNRCIFCSHVHGYRIRYMPIKRVVDHLQRYVSHLNELQNETSFPLDAWTINLNDDDLLLDARRACQILLAIQDAGLKVWGIQTSLRAISRLTHRRKVFDILKNPALYPAGRPLLWIGTDAFTEKRMVRLGKMKRIPDLSSICDDLDRYGIQGYHYWIMTDAETDWEEFFCELMMLRQLGLKYPDTFFVLPNAATLVPYPSSSVFSNRVAKIPDRIILRAQLHKPVSRDFDYPLVLHERPASDFIYGLVEPLARCAERVLFNSRALIDALRHSQWNETICLAAEACRIEIDTCLSSGSMQRATELMNLRKQVLQSLYE